MKIRPLPQSLISRIAAGEVVERPASVVKELIENTLDAGASRVSVEASSGGVLMIRVSDDGSGIAAEELGAAFTRHATSKISAEADLDRVDTLGFRGEALAAIAAVADVTLVTRTKDSTSGAFIRVKDGVVVDEGKRAAPPGTTVNVSHLFRNVPARLKFLKSNSAEAGRIGAVVGHYALSRPDVSFHLAVDGKDVFRSQGNGDRRVAFAALYGPRVAAQMREVGWSGDVDGVSIEVEGLTTPASVSRGNRTFITLFVNGRLIRSRSLVFAVVEAYRGFLGSGRYPMSILEVRLDAGETDVNVHPAKAEIKFRDERLIFSAIHRSVTESLESSKVARPAASIGVSSVNPPEQARPDSGVAGSFAQPVVGSLGLGDPTGEQGVLRVPILRVLGQLSATFIISEGPEGLYVIDQHTAHERVIFDQLRREKERGEVRAQGLLSPVVVEMDPEEDRIVASHIDLLTSYGFQLESFGERAVLLRSVPVGLAGAEPQRALLDVVDYLESEDLRGYDWQDRILASVACHSAVRAGQPLSTQEMQEMVHLLESADNPHACPHGRPILVHMSTAQLGRQFDRR